MAADGNYYEIREVTRRTIYFNAFRKGRPASHFLIRTRVDPPWRPPPGRTVRRSPEDHTRRQGDHSGRPHGPGASPLA
jgi:hypothetical protein